MARLRTIALAASLCLLAIAPTVALAAWSQNGNPVGAAVNNQTIPKGVSDGAGGAIFVWRDARSGFGAIYAQRINALGVPQWTANGVFISDFADDMPQLIADGAGGAIMVWFRNQDIYAQRVNASGATQWGFGGLPVCSAVGGQAFPALVSDNAGGAIVAWSDLRGGVDYDIFVQRINSAGAQQWTLNGVAACSAVNNQNAPQLTADGSGGAVFTWTDWRSGTGDIYVQRVNSAGAMLWALNGVGLCTAADVQSDPSITGDGTGGAIIAWEDNRALQWDVYVRRINSGGVAQWTANGVALSTLANFQWNPVIMSDGLGGAFVAWDDGRTAAIPDVYVQRVNNSGTLQWAANGVALGTIGNGQEPEMVSDGLGGAIVAWQDQRSGNQDIYARRINGSGAPLWTAHGVALCTAVGTQVNVTVVSDGVGGAFVAYEDGRAGATDIYAQRIERNGYWGYPSPNIVNVRDVPGDQGGLVNLAWDASRIDLWPDEAIETYTVWRALDPSLAVVAMAAGENIRVQELNATTYYWQLIHTLGAYGLTGYSDLVPTPFDSTASSQEPVHFQVIAHATTGQWISEPASGRSLDNLAPLAPIQLMAQRVGADVNLIWNSNQELDLDHYAVYRHTASGVTPIPTYFLSSPEDTVLTDANAPNGSLYYIVTAIDSHDNQSAQSNEASVSPVTGVGDSPKNYVLSVSNYPNPFNPRTTVSYSVPSRGRVSVRIYDARGAMVETLVDSEKAAGAYSVEWSPGGAISSGIYFMRIDHNGSTRTQKMVLLK